MSLFRWPILLTAAVCLIVAAAAGAHPLANESQAAEPPVTAPQAPPQPAQCGTPNPHSPVTVTTPYAGTELDGGRGNDRLISTVPNTICGFRGNDYIAAHNGQPQDIQGGPGVDRALIDDEDIGNLASVERCKMTKTQRTWRACPHGYSFAGGLPFGGSARPWSAADFTYPAGEGVLECRLDPVTKARQIYFTRDPTIRAVDSTQYSDWQTVAYAPFLYKWDGTQWVYQQQRPWLWDHTFDEGTNAPFIGNYWRNFQTRARWFDYFDKLDPGTYRVAVKYHWYATRTVPAHDDFSWAGEHLGQFEDPTHQWCNFTS